MQIPLHKIEENKIFIKWRDIKIKPGSVEQAHRHNYFQFMFLEKVEGSHEIDFENYSATANSLHFVGKGRVHKVDYSPKVVGGVFLFPETIFSSSESEMQLLASFTYFKNGAYPILNLTAAEGKLIKDLIEKIKSSLQTDSFDLSKHLLFALLIQVRDIYNKKEGAYKSTKEPQELIQYNHLLKKHLGNWNAVDDYTKHMGITSLRLSNLCKDVYGRTALQILHDRKLLKAKRLLVYTEKQVKEIAYDCGFEDVAYFNRFFKKNTNCTPLHFRKNH